MRRRRGAVSHGVRVERARAFRSVVRRMLRNPIHMARERPRSTRRKPFRDPGGASARRWSDAAAAPRFPAISDNTIPVTQPRRSGVRDRSHVLLRSWRGASCTVRETGSVADARCPLVARRLSSAWARHSIFRLRPHRRKIQSRKSAVNRVIFGISELR